MQKKEKSTGKTYDRSFWIFIAVIIGVTGVIMLINNYSAISEKLLVEETVQHIEETEEMLERSQEEFEQYARVIEKLGEGKGSLELLEKEIVVMEQQFFNGNQLVTGVFFTLFQEGGTVIYGQYPETAEGFKFSEGLSEDFNVNFQEKGTGYWKSMTGEGEESFLYLYPLFVEDKSSEDKSLEDKSFENKFSENKYTGYMGMIVSKDKIKGKIDGIKGNDSWNYEIFLEIEDPALSKITKQEESKGYITNPELAKLDEKKIYTFKRLSNGLIYMEVYERVKQAQHGNEMILLIGLFAIGAMWMIQEDKKTGKTFFNVLSDSVMKNYVNNINSVRRQGNRATIALNIGMAAAVFADVLYSIALGRGTRTIVEYTLFLAMAVGVIFLYKRSKSGITEKIGKILILAGMLGPFCEHIMAGGFSVRRGGESHLWFIICLYIGLFILGTEKAMNVFNAFVILMFCDVVIELILFRQTNYESIYLFAISFILLGFALFVSMEVYVSGAASHYYQTEELIQQLNEDQSLLLQKEKLSALGQLISGVAHEINTPIGAIKASAETMDSQFRIIIKEVLDSAKQFSDEEYDCFLKMVMLTFDSMGKMHTTLEVRAAKKEVKKYFEQIGLENKEEILSYLGQLEIVDLDVIKENIRLFEMENICDILNKTAKLTSFTIGVPTTIYAADRVAQIVQALKSYVHTSAFGELIEFDVIKSIENVLILYRNQLKSNIKIIKKYEKEQCLIIGNPDELSQVWTNLIQNAVQAMKESGELTIEVKEEDEMVIIMIEDTGDGISAQWLEKIYDPFFTTKEIGEGSGLGLNISKKVIEKHHGKLEVESQLGKGSKFYIYLRKDGGNKN